MQVCCLNVMGRLFIFTVTSTNSEQYIHTSFINDVKMLVHSALMLTDKTFNLKNVLVNVEINECYMWLPNVNN